MKRYFPRMHLSTAIIVPLILGVLLWLNMARPVPVIKSYHGSDVFTHFGWPWNSALIVRTTDTGCWGPGIIDIKTWDYTALAADVGAGLFIAAGAVLGIEWVIARTKK